MPRLAASSGLEIRDIRRPFSNFQFLEESSVESYPIRRLLSQARSRNCETLVIEPLDATGAVLDENVEIAGYFPDHQMSELRRVSFWKSAFSTAAALEAQNPDGCLGYSILKRDVVPSLGRDRWHVFESLIDARNREHNYHPCAKGFGFRVGERNLNIHGVVFCQQNSLNKACAQVGLRSMCSTYLGDLGLSYSRINQIAFEGIASPTPWKGLTLPQIEKVFDALDIPHFSLDYASNPDDVRQLLPYQKLLYSGLESGAGAMLVFSMSGSGAGSVMHIIPFFGHTFNEDSWPPVAEGAYFKIGEAIRYIPSEQWMSSFVVHDDNFGSNLCIPKAYVQAGNAQYAVVLLPRDYQYGGIYAEVAAADYFYTLLPKLEAGSNPWRRRLLKHVDDQTLVLRTVPISKGEYLQHVQTIDDWDFKKEDEGTIQALASMMHERMWMVELSIPDLFPANKRKIGEILLSAEKPFTTSNDFSLFLLARFPESYLFFDRLDTGSGLPLFSEAPSGLGSHTGLFRNK
jgi:hypothetical protein